MNRLNMVSAAVGLLTASLSWTGCIQSSQDSTNHESTAAPGPVQSVANVQATNSAASRDPQKETDSRFGDAKLYCLGMLLYAEKHGNLFPTNLDQTLPYLRAANSLPTGTNHFDILYRGSLDKLPNPMTNGIILIRGEPCRTADGKWIRVYGFADGHCEAHSDRFAPGPQ